MALSREKKDQVVKDVETLLSDSKLTVAARYQGTSVQAMQSLRHNARDSGTKVKIIKNRLFKKALQNGDAFKGVDDSVFSGQLLYAFNSEDEIAPAQSLAQFAKQHPQLEFVAALTADGKLLSADEVKTLAALPTKDQLRARVVAVIAAPASGLVNVVAANVRSVLNVLNARERNGPII
jgi:large subunit ribosomal protein L10